MQEAALCGVHCLNTLLQGPVLSEWDLAEVAHRLDALEKEFMLEGGVGTAEYTKFAAEESGNVLEEAIKVWGLKATPLHHPAMSAAAAAPASHAAYICNLSQHWFTLRSVEGQWWNFNSLLPAPQPLSEMYLDAYLNTLKAENWTIYVITRCESRAGGLVEVPTLPLAEASSSNARGRLWTPEEARAATASAEQAQKRGKSKRVWGDVLDMASPNGTSLQLKKMGGDSMDRSGSGDDSDYARACLASMQECSQDADADLAAAIAASMSDAPSTSQYTGASTSAAAAPDHAPSAAAAQRRTPAPVSAVSTSAALQLNSATPASSGGSRLGGLQLGSGGAQTGQVVDSTAAVAGVCGDEPAAGPDVCELSVRAPGNAMLRRRFLLGDALGSVAAWLQGLGWDMQRHQLRFGFPPRVVDDLAATLQSMGMSKRERLLLEPR